MAQQQTTAETGSRCRIVRLGRVDEERGSLCVVEEREIPFEIRRAYWIFGVPPNGGRANHAHRVQYEMLVAAVGSFTVHCDDGALRSSYLLASPEIGLVVPPMVFHHLDGFSEGALCLVFASGPYEHDEYVHEFGEFQELVSSDR